MAFFIHLVATIGILIPTVLGYNIVLGRGKLLHFGHVGVTMFTVYATVLTLIHTGSFFAAVIAGLAASAVASIILWRLALKLEPDAFGILTIAVHLMVMTIVLNWVDLTRGALGIPRIPRMPFLAEPAYFALAAACVAVLWIFFLYRLDRSAFGRKLQALSEQSSHAQALGVNRPRTLLVAFLLAGLGGAITNILFPQYLYLLHPSDYAFSSLVLVVMMIVAGGPGSVGGVTFSVILLTLLKEGLRFVPLPADILGPLRLLLFGVILLACVWWRRRDLFPVQRKI